MDRVEVGIIMGSQSDWPTMKEAAEILDELGVPHEARIVSAHRTPDRLWTYGREAVGRGLKVIIAGAGGAAHLPGMMASKTRVPVIGVPVQTKALSGVDSLYSILQMPRGYPVATMAIGAAGAKNAGLMAAGILALGDPALAEQRMVAVELHNLAQVADELHRPTVAGDAQQRHVEVLVGGEEGVVLAHAFLEPVVQRAQLRPRLGVGPGGDARGGVAFQQREQVVDLRDVVARHLGDEGAAPRLHRHQALGGEHLQRLAQRRAADAVLGRQPLLVDPVARLEPAREDLLAQSLGDLLVERSRGQRPEGRGLGDGHGRDRALSASCRLCIHNYA